MLIHTSSLHMSCPRACRQWQQRAGSDEQETRHAPDMPPGQLQALNQRLREEQLAAAGRPGLAAMQAFRAKLPAQQFRADVLAGFRSAQVVVISGETGCGKTTQVRV